MSFAAHRHIHRLLPNPLDESAYQHCSFISNKSTASNVTFFCELCQTPLASQDELKSHCQKGSGYYDDNPHRIRVRQVQALQGGGTVKRCAALQIRMDEIFPKHEIVDAQRNLTMVLMNSCSLLENGDVPMHRQLKAESEQLLKEAESIVALCENKEGICLLELAAWKTVCVANTTASNKGHGIASIVNYHAWVDWLHGGWKRKKQEMRDDNDIGIIVRCVRPFIA